MRLLTEWTFNDKENILISEIKVYLVYHLKYYFKWRFLYAISHPPLHIEKIQSAIREKSLVIFHKKKSH